MRWLIRWLASWYVPARLAEAERRLAALSAEVAELRRDQLREDIANAWAEIAALKSRPIDAAGQARIAFLRRVIKERERGIRCLRTR